MEFFDRLYLGFEAEYYIMGRLFGAGYEAFKLPADFGFDILVTNQKEQSLKSNRTQRNIQPPYALQIKSRRIKEETFYDGPNGRPETRVKFSIKKQDIDLMLAQDNSYLICVIFISDASGLITNKIISFWLDKFHLQYIKSLGCFREKLDAKGIYELQSCIRLRPTVDTESFIDENLVNKGKLTQEGKKFLLDKLPKTLQLNWEATEYISLVRPPKNDKNSDPFVVRAIPSALTDFKNLGMKISLNLE
ncbi:hypothetical protein LC609_26275 [Nostoc sp. XA013]|nr:hypothetical protein [Nostoc sp. XA013]